MCFSINWNGHIKTGGPKLNNITNALIHHGFSFKVIDGCSVVKSYDPTDPNAVLNAAKNLPANVVRIGSKVTVIIDGEKDVYEICENGNLKENKISYEAPLGKAMLNHKSGETVNADTSNGYLRILIVSIKN